MIAVDVLYQVLEVSVNCGVDQVFRPVATMYSRVASVSTTRAILCLVMPYASERVKIFMKNRDPVVRFCGEEIWHEPNAYVLIRSANFLGRTMASSAFDEDLKIRVTCPAGIRCPVATIMDWAVRGNSCPKLSVECIKSFVDVF